MFHIHRYELRAVLNYSVQDSSDTDRNTKRLKIPAEIKYNGRIEMEDENLALPVLVKAGTPNDGFLSNALKRCFRLSGVPLKLCRLILGCAIKFLSVRFF